MHVCGTFAVTPAYTMTNKALPLSLVIAVITSLLFLRALVGLHKHSGQDNYHGSKVAYGGDYEAQRHWMELTLHLPIGEWYWYDLEYWGLDYPPLTAYVSYLCGLGSSLLVGPETMALLESRGYEDSAHKAYMRATVWALDLLLYFPAVWLIAKREHPNNKTKFLWTVVLALSQVRWDVHTVAPFRGGCYRQLTLVFHHIACYTTH
jgi:alpha-1,3-glucosyltransferase